MTPIKQRFYHDPENGVYGDCHRAALASLLDLPLDAVPHFMHGLGPDDGEAFNDAQEAFLRTRGLTPIIFPIDDERNGLEAVLIALESYNPGVYYLLGGSSANGTGHTVVAGGGKIVHDPARDDSGIVGPMEDGWYWITYVGSVIGIMEKTEE